MRVARISFDQLCVRGGGLTWAMPKNSLPYDGKEKVINEKDDFLFWSLWLYHDHQETISFRHIKKYICRADWVSVEGKTTLYYCLALFKNSLTV